MAATVEQIDAVLPQTQCGQCGYRGCWPYAEAICQGQADINQCPPGGLAGIQKLAQLLGVEAKPLNPVFGIERPQRVAFINEAACIGCSKCLPPCPVDAIIGTSKQMHTVISALCTGCELCVAPCPVDCIEMQSVASVWTQQDADAARSRYRRKQQRLTKLAEEKAERLRRQKQALARANQ